MRLGSSFRQLPHHRAKPCPVAGCPLARHVTSHHIQGTTVSTSHSSRRELDEKGRPGWFLFSSYSWRPPTRVVNLRQLSRQRTARSRSLALPSPRSDRLDLWSSGIRSERCL